MGEKSLYERLGGEPAIHRVCRGFCRAGLPAIPRSISSARIHSRVSGVATQAPELATFQRITWSSFVEKDDGGASAYEVKRHEELIAGM